MSNDSPTGTFTKSANTTHQNYSPQIAPSSAAYTNGDGSNGSKGASSIGNVQEINTAVVSNKAFIDSNKGNGITSPNKNEKPVQKVIPSRNTTPIKYQATSANRPSNGNQQTIGEVTAIVTKDTSTYVKPVSPAVTPVAVATLTHNNGQQSFDKSAKATNKANATKANRLVIFRLIGYENEYLLLILFLITQHCVLE